MTSNHFPIFEPQFLTITWLDQKIPFIPQTVWIYGSEYLLFFFTYLHCKNEENINRYAYSFLAQQIFSVTIFWLWPTTYPRELFPLPEHLDTFTYSAFSNLRMADSPTNCCPSLHVSSVYLCSFMFIHEQRKKFPFFFGWATAIALSTLTTKQHYFVDVVAGVITSLLFFWIFSARVRYLSGAQANR
jgi:membrane-associated phospholipid phosphatase